MYLCNISNLLPDYIDSSTRQILILLFISLRQRYCVRISTSGKVYLLRLFDQCLLKVSLENFVLAFMYLVHRIAFLFVLYSKTCLKVVQLIFISSRCPDWLWGPPSLLCNGYSRLFPWCVKLTTHLQLMMTLQSRNILQK